MWTEIAEQANMDTLDTWLQLRVAENPEAYRHRASERETGKKRKVLGHKATSPSREASAVIVVAPGQHAIEAHMDERGLGKTEGVSSNLTSSSSRFCSSNAERTFRKGQVAVSKPPEAPCPTSSNGQSASLT